MSVLGRESQTALCPMSGWGSALQGDHRLRKKGAPLSQDEETEAADLVRRQVPRPRDLLQHFPFSWLLTHCSMAPFLVPARTRSSHYRLAGKNHCKYWTSDVFLVSHLMGS